MVTYVSEPKVRLISRPQLDWNEIASFLVEEGYYSEGETGWASQRQTYGEGDSASLAEFMGRLCYRSFPGTKTNGNENITKVRDNQWVYLRNILDSNHGSVLEHVNYSFVISGVSRVESAEHRTHRVGTATSHESGRYVRNPELSIVLPESGIDEVDALMHDALRVVGNAYREINNSIPWDEMEFAEKKELTSLIRRFLPQGQKTTFGWTANIRALRHTIELRTAPSAEKEIREVFDQVYKIMMQEAPIFFADFESVDGWHRRRQSGSE